MPTLIQLAKSKTLWFSTALTVLGLAQQFIGAVPLTAIQQSYALMAIGVTSALLRFVTSQALADK